MQGLSFLSSRATMLEKRGLEQGATSPTHENPGLRQLARLIARTILSENLTQGKVPVSLGDKNRSG